MKSYLDIITEAHKPASKPKEESKPKPIAETIIDDKGEL